MVDTWSVSNNQGWSRISLSLRDRLHCLVEVSSHCDLSNIYIAIAHCNTCQIFLLGFLSACRELCHCTCLCSLGGLSTCVRVNFSIEYHNIDILSACKDMIQSTESDVISPSVSAENPLWLFSEEIFIIYDILTYFTVTSRKCRYQLICSSSICSSTGKGIKPFLTYCLHFFGSFIRCRDRFYFCFQSISDRFVCKHHTVTKLCVIFKEGVRPCRSFTFCVHSVRCRWWWVTPDRRTSCCVRNIHSVSE